jgi:hypothetical protein
MQKATIRRHAALEYASPEITSRDFFVHFGSKALEKRFKTKAIDFILV